MVDVELYTSPSCLHCQEAKMIAEELRKKNPTINLRSIDVSREEGARAAFKNKVLTLPTFLIRDESGELRVTEDYKNKLMEYFDRRDYVPQGDGPRFLKIGAGLGIYSILMSLVFGLFCPSCLVVAIGAFLYGLFKEYTDRLKTKTPA